MRMKSLKPVLYVADIDAAIRFYEDVLGFECTHRIAGWASLLNYDVELMISLPNAHLPFEKPAFTGSFYFNPDDVDALWDKLKDKVTIVYPIEDFSYGMREFAIRDNNGYCLQFGSEIEDESHIPPPETDS
jgi:uncharacterized glyoxalase superfamily protein PhnB